MNVYDLKGLFRSRDLNRYNLDTEGCIIRGLADSNLEFHYSGDGTVELVGVPEYDDDIEAWLPMLNREEINTIIGTNITASIFSLPNITTAIFTKLTRLNGVIQNSIETGVKKVVSYIGPPVSVIINVKFNPDIIQLNLPLNQNIEELVANNPQLISVGISSYKFNYWNLLPDLQRYVVYTSSLLDSRFAAYYIRSPIEYITYSKGL